MTLTMNLRVQQQFRFLACLMYLLGAGLIVVESCAHAQSYPDDVPALIRLGEAELHLGEKGGETAASHYVAAEEALARAIALKPGEPRAVYGLSSVYMRTGRTEDSIALLSEGLRMQPDAARLHAKLGYSLRYVGLFKRSIGEYRLAQQLDPADRNWIECERQIIKSFIYSGHQSSAIASYAQILHRLETLKEEPDEKLLFYQGVGRIYLDDTGAAVAFFDASIARGADSVWSDFAAAYRAAALGRQQQLRDLADRLEQGNVSDGERRYRLAHLNALAGRPEKALVHLEQSARSGFFSYSYTRSDALLANIRDSDEFRRILAYIKERHDDVVELLD